MFASTAWDMRTTLTLDDDLAMALQDKARTTGRPFKEVVNAWLREGIDLAKALDLVALALEYGGTVHSADSDFARFPDVRWVNPLAR